MVNFLKYAAERLKERSTWGVIFGILATLGLASDPAKQDLIVQIGTGIAALAGSYLVVTKDKPAA